LPAGPLLIVLTGPSGAGKDSVLARLRSLGRPYHYAVTATTRPPRPGEEHGVDYQFVSQDEWRRMLAADEFLEHALVYGQEKGVPRAPVREALAQGKDVILRTDIQGARTIKSRAPGALTIFVAAPSPRELERRLRERGGDTQEQMEVRLREAEEEMAVAGAFDYTVVNDDLERCTEEVEEIIAKERAREGRVGVRV